MCPRRRGRLAVELCDRHHRDAMQPPIALRQLMTRLHRPCEQLLRRHRRTSAWNDEHYARDQPALLAQTHPCALDPIQLLRGSAELLRELLELATSAEDRWRLVHEVSNHLTQVAPTVVQN